MEYYRLAIGLLALLCCINAESYLGSGYETVYDYFGDVRAGSNFPEEYASQFGIKAKLNIQYVDSDHAIFKFNDVSYQVSTGQLADQETSKAKFLPAPEESAFLMEPFQVNYDSGKVKSVLTVDEPEWSENIKKAVAAIFQIDIKNLRWNKPYSFVTEEPTLYGDCPVGYTIQPKDAGWVDVIKTQEYEKCKHMPYRYYTNGIYESCPFDHKEDKLLPGTIRYYKLLTGKGRIEVKEIFSQSLTAAIPFNGKSDDQTILVRQNFTLVSLDKIKEKFEFTPKHERDLKYTIPHYYNEVGTYNDLTGGHHVKNEAKIMEMTHKTLGELVDFMEVLKVTKDPEHLNTQLSQRLVFLLGQSNMECLVHCFEKYEKPTTYRDENLRGAFLEIAAQVGSKASVLFIRDVVVKHKVPESLAIELLRLVPFYVRDPSVNILHEYETLLNVDLSTSVKKAAVLSVSNMVYLTWKHVHDMDIINSWAEQFYKSFKEESDYAWKLNYLTALANLEEGKVFEYLVEIIHDKTYSNTLRYIALWGTKEVATKDHVKGYELHWPIFSNQEERIDMRASAMKLFLKTDPSFDRFVTLFWFMQAETRSQLYYYFYTAFESLSHTNHPCYMTAGHHAERLFRYAKKPTTSYLFTGNYLKDHMDFKHSLGGDSVLSLIGDPDTGAPSTIYYSQGGYYSGYSHNYFGVLVRMTVMAESIKNQIMKGDVELNKIADLEKVLSDLHIKPIHLKDFHVEVVFYTSERVVETRFYDESNFMKFMEDIRGFGKGDYKIHQHNFIYSGIHEYVQPTDIGMPAVWNLAVPYSYSLVANFTNDVTGPSITRNNEIKIRYGRFGGHSLSFYNPLGGIWQGAYRQHSFIYNLPIHNHLSFNVQQRQFKFTIIRDPEEDFNLGMVYHVRTQVFATDYEKSDVLHESCPKCLPYVTVHKPGKAKRDFTVFDYDSSETGLEYKLEIFDCDQPHSPYDLATDLYEGFDSRYLNYGHNPFSHFFLGLRKLHTFVGFQPSEGSCGIIFQGTPSVKYPYTQLEGVLHSISERVKDNNMIVLVPGGKYTLRGAITLKGDDAEHVYHTFDFNAELEHTHDTTENHLSVKVTHTSPKEKEFKFCMDVETKYPEIPADMYVVRKESEEQVTGKLSVIWGESKDEKCPTDGSGLKVTMTATVPHVDHAEHLNVHPYKECHHDAEDPEWKGKSFTPITEACVAAAMDATTLRKFTGYVKYFNIPEKYVSYADIFMSFMKTAGEFHLISYKEGEKTVDDHKPTFDVPHQVKGKQGEMKYVVDFEKYEPYVDFHMSWEGEEHEQNYRLKYDTFGFEPYFMSSRFFLLKHLIYESGYYASCVVTPSSVLTLDNNTYHYHSSHCWTLVTADCSEHPRYAVFVKKVEGPHDMALKIYSGGNIMEIIPNKAGEFDVTVNDHPVSGGLYNGYGYPEEASFSYFRVTKKDKFVNIDSSFSYAEVDYTGHSVVISMPGFYRGIACGLCGDFNNDEVYFERMGEISHSCHKTHYDAVDGDYLGYRYTYRDSHCPEITEEMAKHVECTEHHH